MTTHPVTLRALGWQHPRCTDPMRAAARAWNATDRAQVDWTFRPLSAFEDQTLSDVSAQFDLMLIDHPLIPAAVEDAALLPWDDLHDISDLNAILASTVGPSARSYQLLGRTWALPVDAATQVSVTRAGSDDVRAAGNWGEVVALSAQFSGRIAIPLNAPHTYCTVLTLMGSRGTSLTPGSTSDDVRGALEELMQLRPHLHPSSYDWDPPTMLEAMATTDQVVYSPCTYGYVTYAEPEVGRTPLRFHDIPAHDGSATGATLGGVGIAVTRSSEHAADAAEFAAWLCHSSTQSGVILQHGGQPAHSSVWEPAGPGGAFFAETRRSLLGSRIRPRLPRSAQLQASGGAILREALIGRAAPGDAVSAFLRLSTQLHVAATHPELTS